MTNDQGCLFSHIANLVNLAYIHTFRKLKILNSHNSVRVYVRVRFEATRVYIYCWSASHILKV